MKFIDEALVTVQSGDGGKGCVSFRREKYVPRGGPDGGDGGKGGNVVIKTSPRKRTLYHLRFKRHFRAKNGANGLGKRKTGRNGADATIEVPAGTLVFDTDTDHLICDLVTAHESYIIARGGRGGQGNARFKTSTNRAPRFAQPGASGEILNLKLELKLLADIGIIGLPNAGKSTLLSKISAASPKIADYPFTTLTPNLGVVHTEWAEPFVVADIPGLIEGAHQGAGLGTHFLKHIERTRMLLHLIDASTVDPHNPLSAFQTVNSELCQHNRALNTKPQLIVLNKLDIIDTQKAVDAVRTALDRDDIMTISAATGQGLDQLKSKLVNMLDAENGD